MEMKTLGNWPVWLDNIWAKSKVNNMQNQESLAEHTWNVLCRLKDLTRLRPWLPGLSSFPGLWNILFWAAFLHDWGKGAAGFQAMLRGQQIWSHRHEVLSLIFLDWVSEVFLPEELDAVVAAIVCHHKDAEEILDIYYQKLSPEDDPLANLINELDEEHIKLLWRLLSESAMGWINELGFDELGVKYPAKLMPQEQAVNKIRQNGAEILHKLLRSYRRLIRELKDGETKWVIPGIILRGCLLQVDHIGSAHTGTLPNLDLTSENILKKIDKELSGLYKHQYSSFMTKGSAILIAPTGSGKTEAALLWATRQVEDKFIPRLFYTLPYQASMNAMYDRLNGIFPGQVGLLHSRSLLALYRRLMDADYGMQQAVQKARTFQNLARLYYYPIQVSSPYQMLKAGFQLKGYEAMLAEFAGAAFIFDEIHAYDPERLALTLEFASFLKRRLNATFFVMSATMPSFIQRRVEEVLEQPTIIRANNSLFKDFIRHQVHLLNGDLLAEENLQKIKVSFQQGNSVLVTCNTVKRAVNVYLWLKNHLPPESVIMVHSRFNYRDRLKKEQEIIISTGLNSNERRPVVVVSTQVVEVSLNIDLDILFSDPAPLEALVQRFGRINRGRRRKIASVFIFNEPSDGQGVYSFTLVEQALKILSKYADGRTLDEGSVQNWLDEIYTGPILEEWESKYQKTAKEFRLAFIDNLRPFASDETLASQFDKMFNGIEVLPLCLEQEYRDILHENSLEASQLLVPISWTRWSKIKSSKLVCSNPVSWPPVVNVPYSSEYGLG